MENVHFATIWMLSLAAVLCAGCSSDEQGQSIAASQNPSPPFLAEGNGHESEATNPAGLSASASPLQESRHSVTPTHEEHLQTEAGMIESGSLSAEAASHTLSSSDTLQHLVRSMQQDASGSLEARDLSVHYGQRLKHALTGTATIESFACGLSVCAGSVRSQTLADQEAWAKQFAEDPAAPAYSLIHLTESTGSMYENRFIFSIDPSMNSIVDSFDQ